VNNFQSSYSDLVSSLKNQKEQTSIKITQFKEFIRLTNIKEDKSYSDRISQQSKKIEEEILEYKKKISDSLVNVHHFCYHSSDYFEELKKNVLEQTYSKFFRYNSYFCKIKMPKCIHNFDISPTLLKVLFNPNLVEIELQKLKEQAEKDTHSLKRKELVNLISAHENSVIIKYIE